jgi:predicted O-linked N-acetylglucosamine transferase (SPINDLY family)
MQFNLAGGLFETAQAQFAAGRLAESLQTCRQALQLDPRHAPSLYLMGTLAGEAGQPGEALRYFDQVLVLEPNVAEIHGNRGIALMSLDRPDEAEQSIRRSLELDPRLANSWYALGNLKSSQKDHPAAFEAFLRALEIDPRDGRSWTNMGIALQQMGRLDDALAAYQRAVGLLPNEALIYYNIGIALLAVGRTDESLAANLRALELAPDYVMAHSNLLISLTYMAGASSAELLANHQAWDKAHADALKPAFPPMSADRNPERRLKIGYVSGDFRQHPVGWLLANVLPAHDRSQVEVFCYVNDTTADDVTERLRASADHWRGIVGLSDAAAADLVRGDGIDILVDLSGHTSHNRLLMFARLPAPLQVSWLGYPSTTGLSSIDYLIMDEATAPAGAEAWCSETLVRLPHGRFCYAAPLDAPQVAERPEGPVTFGSFNHLAKVGPDVVRLWARVLDAVPQSRLVLKWKSLSEPSAQARLTAAFAAHGIGPDRLELRGGSTHADLLAEYGDIDIVLDSFPYSGGITSAEALWMGVPMVTWPQDRIASRQTLAFLTELGLTDLAAGSEDEYVAIAAALAGDTGRRAELRKTLRSRMAALPMTDGAQFTPGLEAAYRQMWRRWCEGEAPRAITIEG